MVRLIACMLVLVLVCVPSLRAQTAVLDLGSDDDAVIGLHVTADSIREAVGELGDACTHIVFTLDSRGGFLAETPALAELFARELPERFEVALVVKEASSTAALVALASPRLAITHDGFLGGHAPFERLGEVDLDLVDDDLDTAISVAEACAILGDRPQPAARALVSRVPLEIDGRGMLTNTPGHDDVIHAGDGPLTLTAADAVRTHVADLALGEGEDPVSALGFPVERAPAEREACLALEQHRDTIDERLAAFDRAWRTLDTLLASPLDDEAHRRALDALGELETIHLVRPRIALLRGVDGLRLSERAERIESQRRAFADHPADTMPP
ncbi:MAG: hypothetical protein Tsb0013_07110 [Phycisphaerales bacterium]